jgi:transcriptional regulator, IclR family
VPANKPESSATPEAKTSIQVIERMMKLLDVLAQHADPVPLKQLALETGLHPSTAHRILGAMTTADSSSAADAGIYRLGIRLLELGSIVKSRISLRETAMPFMLKLHAATGESVNLGVRAGDEIVYVERTSSGRSSVRVVHIVGAARRCTPRPPASCSWSRTASSASATTRAAPACRRRRRPPSPPCPHWKRSSTACAATAWASTSTKSKPACAASPPASATTTAS